jgi:hypothetical protein
MLSVKLQEGLERNFMDVGRIRRYGQYQGSIVEFLRVTEEIQLEFPVRILTPVPEYTDLDILCVYMYMCVCVCVREREREKVANAISL